MQYTRGPRWWRGAQQAPHPCATCGRGRGCGRRFGDGSERGGSRPCGARGAVRTVSIYPDGAFPQFKTFSRGKTHAGKGAAVKLFGDFSRNGKADRKRLKILFVVRK